MTVSLLSWHCGPSGVFKAKKHLAFLKSLHAHANGGPKGTNIEEATLLCSCIGIGKPISKEDVCKVCDTYAANREHISKSSIKALCSLSPTDC